MGGRSNGAGVTLKPASFELLNASNASMQPLRLISDLLPLSHSSTLSQSEIHCWMLLPSYWKSEQAPPGNSAAVALRLSFAAVS